MHPCAVLLGEVLVLSNLEEEALADENFDQVEDLAAKRAQLLQQAWKEREGYDVELLRNTLMVIEAMHRRLQDIAGGMHDNIAKVLQNSKKQSKYLSDASIQTQKDNKAFFFNKIS